MSRWRRPSGDIAWCRGELVGEADGVRVFNWPNVKFKKDENRIEAVGSGDGLALTDGGTVVAKAK